MNALCSICLELFHNTLRDNAFSPKCGHVFHHSCILDWHEKSPTCPDCRESFTKNEIYKLNFHCDDVSDANPVTETKFKELQLELTKKNEEIAELQLELAKKNSEISELEENCRTVLDKVESLSLDDSMTGLPDNSAAWVEYYRSIGMHKEAAVIEKQAKASKSGGAQQIRVPGLLPRVSRMMQSQQVPIGQQQRSLAATPQQLEKSVQGGQPDYNAQLAHYYPSLGKIKEAEVIEAQIKTKAPDHSLDDSMTGLPDYSAAWVEYYRSIGMHKEAAVIEKQAEASKSGGAQQIRPPGLLPRVSRMVQSQQVPIGQQQRSLAATPQQLGKSDQGGQPDYNAQLAHYYRSLGKIKEAEVMEAQTKTRAPNRPIPARQSVQLSNGKFKFGN